MHQPCPYQQCFSNSLPKHQRISFFEGWNLLHLYDCATADAVLPETCPSRKGFVWVFPASAAYLGTSLGLAAHSTSVHCLVVGIDEPVTVAMDGEPAINARSILIPPRVVHQIVATAGARVLFCYVDVTRARGADLFSHMQNRAGSLGVTYSREAVLINLCGRETPDGEAIMRAVCGDIPPTTDPRISRTMRRLRENPADSLSATGMAHIEGLSTAYFLRLFGQEVGTSFRRYRAWARMLHAARAVSQGANLTRASSDAGFASPSHFSDTFLRMFGLTATDMFNTGAHLCVTDRLPRM